MTPTLSIRTATPGDAPALARLAALDSQPVPAGLVLLAEQDGAPVAALALPSGATLADPFERTTEARAVLAAAAAARRERARERRPLRLGRLRPA
jgi:hypothetical protein